MITSNVAYAALAYLPINPRSQASLQRALVAKSAATIVATIQSNPSEQRKHKKYYFIWQKSTRMFAYMKFL